jgi:hypothetical protein
MYEPLNIVARAGQKKKRNKRSSTITKQKERKNIAQRGSISDLSSEQRE